MDISTNERPAMPNDFCAVDGAKILKAMANRHRLYILCRLKEREYSVGKLKDIVGLSQSALSQHLARLRKDELVQTRRSAQMIFYSLVDNDASRILDSICKILMEPTQSGVSEEAAC
jgi:DNA-binding transcriptional ArsR family regulator